MREPGNQCDPALPTTIHKQHYSTIYFFEVASLIGFTNGLMAVSLGALYGFARGGLVPSGHRLQVGQRNQAQGIHLGFEGR